VPLLAKPNTLVALMGRTSALSFAGMRVMLICLMTYSRWSPLRRTSKASPNDPLPMALSFTNPPIMTSSDTGLRR